MAQNFVAGSSAVLLYGYETTFGTEVTGTNPFGAGVDLSISRKNNLEKVYGVGSRNATTTVAKQYEGSLSLNFALANGNFFFGILGTTPTDSPSGDLYTHTYVEDNTTFNVPSFSVDNSIEMGTNDMVSTYVSCKINSATISANVNDIVKVSLDTIYKTETLATSTKFTNVAETEGVFTFANGTIEIPDGTTIAAVQSFEMTMTNNLEYLWGVGSRLATAGVEKQRDYAFKISAAFNNITTLLTYFLDGTDSATAPDASTPTKQATLILTFTNGAASPNTESIVMTFADIWFDDESLPQNVNDIVKEDVTGHALSCTSVVWTNNTATAMAVT